MVQPISSMLVTQFQLLPRKNIGNGNSNFMEDVPYAFFWNNNFESVKYLSTLKTQFFFPPINKRLVSTYIYIKKEGAF